MLKLITSLTWDFFLFIMLYSMGKIRNKPKVKDYSKVLEVLYTLKYITCQGACNEAGVSLTGFKMYLKENPQANQEYIEWKKSKASKLLENLYQKAIEGNMEASRILLHHLNRMDLSAIQKEKLSILKKAVEHEVDTKSIMESLNASIKD